MQGKKLTEQQRVCVMALLLTGETIPRTAELTGVSAKSVERIKASPEMAGLDEVMPDRAPSLEVLVTDHLVTSLRAVNAIARHVESDDAWFAKQSAADIAALYGTLSDTAVRIYEAKCKADELAFKRRRLEAEDDTEDRKTAAQEQA